MTNPEQRVKNKLMRALDKIPNTYYFTVSEPSRRGLPDMVACIKGRFFGIEFKATPPPHYGSRVKLQKENMNRINKADGIGVFVHPQNLDHFISLVSIDTEWTDYELGQMEGREEIY